MLGSDDYLIFFDNVVEDAKAVHNVKTVAVEKFEFRQNRA
jgi:hypothetical protein